MDLQRSKIFRMILIKTLRQLVTPMHPVELLPQYLKARKVA